MSRTPVNLITGFLGVGKTTLVIELLRRKSARERWAVLVNEYGEVGIDGAMIDGEGADGVTVREVAGGCICCATAPYLPVALAMILQDGPPDRLIVETTGLGHPARLIDMFRSPAYHDRLELRATIGLVAPADVTCPGMFENPVFLDQATMADVLILTKRDKASDDAITAFQQWAEAMYPPKLLIAAASHGVIDLEWLDLMPTHERLPQFPEAHAHQEPVPVRTIGLPSRGQPLRFESPSGMTPSCGWLFSPADRFGEDGLLALFGRPEISRGKGVFRVEHDWIAINKANDNVTVKHTAYRRDSRLELFGERNWDHVERDLLACLLNESNNGG